MICGGCSVSVSVSVESCCECLGDSLCGRSDPIVLVLVVRARVLRLITVTHRDGGALENGIVVVLRLEECDCVQTSLSAKECLTYGGEQGMLAWGCSLNEARRSLGENATFE